MRLFCSIGPAMNRREAIDHVTGLSARVASDFCPSKAQEDRLEQDTRAALRALGVTDAEIDEAEKG